jgi:DNA-binding response OmpR family regulator
MQMVNAVGRRAILCIEKDSEARALHAQTLSEYELVFTMDAFETIRSMNARAFDGYIIDYWLPDWSGPQLCRAIRDVDPHCPVIFCTAAQSELGRVRSMRAGASAYFSKPVDAAALRTDLNGLMARADTASLRAKACMEEAVYVAITDWKRRTGDTGDVTAGKLHPAERIARSRAYKAFLEGGGTRAHFERWWPHVFGSAVANSRTVCA